ncbi:FliH/SctL family protein [Planococcus salinus]|uniref:Flagellar assembly protein FliH n=1 Tax=Planococcus salinus TaxID=1848460 RepID=A0A3M8P531_9BACL|nr:FliH/SctL family protein [Planococcus salinus]RNF38755.1 flagellar assembly protein FliH [Planococcus salinus]
MSNIIRFHQPTPIEKKIIRTKKIEHQGPILLGKELDPIQKRKNLLSEIEILEKDYKDLQQQLQQEQEAAHAEIAEWWQEKRREAEQEAARLAQEATEKGFHTGLSQGTLQAENDFREQRQAMQELIETAHEEKARIVQQSEPFLLSLSVKIAEKVIKEELKQNDEQLLNIVKQALRHIEESEDIVLQVALEDYPYVLPFLEELKTYVRAESELKIIPVIHLAKGDCMIQTANGSYDVTIDSQLQEIKKQLLAYCEEKTTDEPAHR